MSLLDAIGIHPALMLQLFTMMKTTELYSTINTKPTVAILSVATALPLYKNTQTKIAEKMAIISGLNPKETRWLKKLYSNSSIQYRYSVLENFIQETKSWQIFDHRNPLSTGQRNAIYKKEAPPLAYSAAEKALNAWGGERTTITHIIFISCTGVIAPGIQSYLQQALGLSPDINQTGLNMMGCFGAFKGLDIARAYAQQNAQHRVLVICCELCTLHLQATHNPEHQVGNAIFADGAAACIVGMPKARESALYAIERTASHCLAETEDRMTWEVGDTGFIMGLKADIPSYVEKNIAAFVQKLLPAGVNAEECLWPVHPGGKQILCAVQKALDLSKNQLASSWHVLEQYGNMSSATFLFVLDHLRQQKKSLPIAIGVGFGPGLMLEGVLLRAI